DLRADHPVRPGLVVDDERLLEALAQPLRQRPKQHVLAAAGRKRVDDANRPCRVALRRSGRRQRKHPGDDRPENGLHQGLDRKLRSRKATTMRTSSSSRSSKKCFAPWTMIWSDPGWAWSWRLRSSAPHMVTVQSLLP